MIKGARFWNERLCYHVQTNNPTEQYLKKLGVAAWLQTCGPTAAVNCLDALGYKIALTTPGGYKPQPEEVLTDFFNDPANVERFKPIRSDIEVTPGNYWPALYPAAVREVFGARAMCLIQFKDWKKLVENIVAGSAVQLHLVKPGHYVAAVAYDDATRELVIWDSWPREANNFDGFGLRMDQTEYERNVRDFIIRYDPPAGHRP